MADSEPTVGMFTLFTNRRTGDVQLMLTPEDIGKEYIHAVTIHDAPISSDYFRGASLPLWKGQGVVTIHRRFNTIEFIRENTKYSVRPTSSVGKTDIANLSTAVLAVAEIIAEDETTGAVLLDAGPLFLSEAFIQLTRAPNAQTDFSLGTLSNIKTRFDRIRSYQDNVDFYVRYVYENPSQTADEDEAFSDHRYTSITLQHSLVRMPKNDYVPRPADPRVGYFVARVTDLLDIRASSWRDWISRWNLKKSSPNSDLSVPVNPIVFWIENTTPPEYRAAVREGVLAWNPAFETAGFKDALEVRVQPHDADWDAGDIRHNVIQWQVTPKSWFGAGISQTISNPRTGQILAADVVLDHREVSSRIQTDRLFSRDDLQSGRAKVQANGLLYQFIRELTLHEVGHALGLTHNLRASQLFPPEHLYNAEATRQRGISGSVMDLLVPNIVPPGYEQGLYHQIIPGAYDHWAIEYGYSESLLDVDAETARLQALLARSTEPQLAFGNDADAIWTPDTGIDPTITAWDASSDALRYADDRLGLLNALSSQLLTKFTQNGSSYGELTNAFGLIKKEIRYQVEVVSHYVGGIRTDRSIQGQRGAPDPFEPVSRKEQQRAMAILTHYVFGVDVFGDLGNLYRHLKPPPRDFDLSDKTEDPKIHEEVLALQRLALDYLLHPVVLERLSDTALYGNAYTTDNMMRDLTAAIFDADIGGVVNPFRQNLQAEYVQRLCAISSPSSKKRYDQPSRAMALNAITELRKRLTIRSASDVSTNAHTAALLSSIVRSLEHGK